MMWREFTRRGSYRWIDLLPSLLKKYNGTVHRTIRARPRDAVVTGKVLPAAAVAPTRSRRLKVGDKVRVSRVKKVFDKGYLQNWTNEVFTVDEVRKTVPVTYGLKDYAGEKVRGGFYRQELQKTLVVSGGKGAEEA